MKKIVFAISAFLLFTNIVMAQQDSTLINASKSGSNQMKQDDKKYSDSSSKYFRYGSDSTKARSGNKMKKPKNKRDKTDSINPANPVNK